MHLKFCSVIFIISLLCGCSKPYKPSGGFIKGSDSIKEIFSETKIIKENTDNPVVTQSAENIETHAAKVEKVIEKQDRALFEAKNSYYQMYQRWLTTIMLLSGLAVGVSIALFFMGTIKSLTLTAVAVALFVSAVTLQFLSAWLPWIAGISILIISGTLIYQVYVRNKSSKEIVESVQEGIKAGAVNLAEFAPIANKFQKTATKHFVDSIQKRLAKKK